VDNVECDFTTMTQILKKDIHKVIKELQSNLEVIDDEDNCLLCNFEKIKADFLDIEIKAATFYLNCYLAPFTDTYPELSISLQNMSRMKHGGLIVIEREDSLETLIRPGIPMGAELTHSLLESIFYPGNPLHDGAVLVRLNKIVSAANVLPLSDIYTGDKKLGTRHRAALGLSERSDALVLVVSEETGRVSFAKGGNMYPITTHGGL
jgi:diadenylate cyclase